MVDCKYQLSFFINFSISLNVIICDMYLCAYCQVIEIVYTRLSTGFNPDGQVDGAVDL